MFGAGAATVGAATTPAVVGATGAIGAGVGAGAIGAGVGAGTFGAGVGTGAIGASSFTDSCTSVAALRNSRMLLPSAEPTSGSLPGPMTRSAITRMMTSSTGPMFGIAANL